jgi:hypothetical protein
MNSGFSGTVGRLAAAQERARAFDYRPGLPCAAKADCHHGDVKSGVTRAIANRLTLSTWYGGWGGLRRLWESEKSV